MNHRADLIRQAGPIDDWTERDHVLYDLGYDEGAASEAASSGSEREQELTNALRELGPLIAEACRLACDKSLASSQVYYAIAAVGSAYDKLAALAPAVEEQDDGMGFNCSGADYHLPACGGTC